MTAPKTLRQRRPSASASASASASSASLPASSPLRSASERIENTFLLLFEDLPTWRRDNNYLLTGYRPAPLSFRHSLASLLSLHNETVNIWTHLLGAVLFVAFSVFAFVEVAPRYASASSSDVLVMGCFLCGAITCLGMSATFHTLSDHSETVAKIGLRLDYTGIILLTVGSFIPALYYGFFCHPVATTVHMFLIFLFGLGCLTVCWLEHFSQPAYRPVRTFMFISLGLTGLVPAIHGLLAFGFQEMENKMQLSYVLAEGAMYISGALIYAFRWPEKNYPGTFDIWGSSHQIFHILVLLAVASHLCAMAGAFDHHHTVLGGQCLNNM